MFFKRYCSFEKVYKLYILLIVLSLWKESIYIPSKITDKNERIVIVYNYSDQK
jgi:hypothetical protein